MNEQEPYGQGGLQTSDGQDASGQPSPGNVEGLVFNVMPQNKNQGQLVQAKMKLEPPSSGAPADAASPAIESLKKYKWYFIGALGVAIAGLGIYFLVGKLGSGSYKSDDLLVKNPPAAKAPAVKAPALGMTTPQAWRDKYFPNCSDAQLCGDNADPDHDGLTNSEEFSGGTDPNNPDSDQDGLADGDEAKVFGLDPLKSHTSGNSKFSDADYIKGGFDFKTDKKLTADQITAISGLMKQFGLHQPSLTTLGEILNKLYSFTPAAATTTASSTLETGTTAASSTPASTTSPSNLDQSIEAKQDRDAQRSNTIKNIEIALVKYQADNKVYPQIQDFASMFTAIKPYLKVATNPLDPINKDPYLYSYVGDASGADFTLSFFSEVAGLPIKKHAADAVKDSAAADAAIYDDQRKNDLESLRTSLLLYSQQNVAGNEDYVFPAADKYKTALVPDYISQIPKDPKTGADYQYQVSATFNTFTLKTPLDAPDAGTTGYLCNQDSCQDY